MMFASGAEREQGRAAPQKPQSRPDSPQEGNIMLRQVFDRVSRIVGRKDILAYHPERHYMRGAGPAWRRKNSGTAI